MIRRRAGAELTRFRGEEAAVCRAGFGADKAQQKNRLRYLAREAARLRVALV